MNKIVKMFSALGTINTIIIYCDNTRIQEAHSVLDNIESNINDLDDKLSVFKSTSEVSLINQNAGIKFTKVSKSTFEILRLSKQYASETNGAFDITAKPIIDLWQKSIHGGNRPPDPKDIKRALKVTDYKHIILCDEDSSAMLKNKGQAIDLGGIAKGYILDKVKDTLKASNFSDALINLGGSISSMSVPRKIGIRNPFFPVNSSETERFFAVLSSMNENIVTSGSYEQFFYDGSKRYHHILDPKTGYPTDKSLLSVTLIGNDGAKLDAFATACFVMGLEKSINLIKGKMDAIFVLTDGKIYITDTLIKRVTITCNNNTGGNK